jgi:hypothetical protein
MVSSLAAAVAKLEVTKDKVKDGSPMTTATTRSTSTTNRTISSRNKHNDTTSTHQRINHKPSINNTSTTRKNSISEDNHMIQNESKAKKLSSLASYQLKHNTNTSSTGKSRTKTTQKQKKDVLVASYVYDLNSLSSESESEDHHSRQVPPDISSHPSKEKKDHYPNRNSKKSLKDTRTHDGKVSRMKETATTKETSSFKSTNICKDAEKQYTTSCAKPTIQLLSSSQLEGRGAKIKQNTPLNWADDDDSSDSD